MVQADWELTASPFPVREEGFEADRRLREKLTRRDLGIWSHYGGDASQPLHVSVHYNGWGDYPNPEAFTTKKSHAHFEGAFVKRNLQRDAVAAEVAPYQPCGCSMEERTKALLLASLVQVAPLYSLEKDGCFKKGDSRGATFATRLAAGAQAVRDMIVQGADAAVKNASKYILLMTQDR